MSERYANVSSVDALRHFRVAMLKFAEKANASLGDAESEMQRLLVWLETEQHAFWQGQVRKRTEEFAKAKEAVRMKKIFKDATGGRQSAVDEEKALAVAVRRLEEADQKLKNVKKHGPRLVKEIQMYKGSVQRFATAVSADVPVAAGHLERLVAALEAYTSLAAPVAPPDVAGSPPGVEPMARAEPEEAAPPSPGTPGEGGGEGDSGLKATPDSKSPSPQPSPGIPGEGTKHMIRRG
ncbi:MAG: hypothetical protein ACREIT_02255 [Tepidisphaeraceae bacterium]